MANINQTFQAQSNVIATYAYTDVAEGTGIVKFYGYTTQTDSGLDYHLGTNPFYSSDIETIGSTATTSFTVASDLDFDLSEFNLPKTIKGTATINVTLDSTGDVTPVAYIHAYIRKWDGTPGAGETEIANGRSQELSNTTKELCIPIPITTKTHFKRGETLRLTIVLYGKRASAGTYHYSYGHDPQNRDGSYNLTPSSDATITTKLEFFCPFIIDQV